MLHAEVRCLDELVAVGVPRIGTEPTLETAHQWEHLLKLAAGRVDVIVERPEVECQPSCLAVQGIAEMRVVTGIDRHVVVVDRTRDEPLVGRRAVAILRGAPQPAVRDIDQRIGHRDRDALAVRLVGEIVLVGPPHAGAQSFVRGRDPRAAEAVGRECESAIPRQPPADPRLAVIPHRDRAYLAGPLRRAQRHEERVAVAPVGEFAAILYHAVHDERLLEIDLHLPRRLKHAVGDPVPPDDAGILQVHARVQVVELRVPPGARGSVGAAQRVGMRVVCGVLGHGLQADQHHQDHRKTRSPLNFLRRGSHGKKITTRKASFAAVGACESHLPFGVPVTAASSHTPCGPITICCRSK